MRLFPAQVQKAITQARFLAQVGIAENLHRQSFGGAFDVEFVDPHFDRAGRDAGIDRFFRALDHRAGDRHHAFGTHPFDTREQRTRNVDHALRQAIVVAQVDEQQVPVVALAMDPAGQANGLADVGFAQLATGMGAVRMHEGYFPSNNVRDGSAWSDCRAPKDHAADNRRKGRIHPGVSRLSDVENPEGICPAAPRPDH